MPRAADFHRAAPQTSRRALGLEKVETGGATLFVARREPGILLNRALGLGQRGAASLAGVQAVRDRYLQAGVLDYFLQIQPWAGPAELWNWLFDQGFNRSRGWTQFVRSAGPASGRRSRLRVALIDHRHAAEFATIAAAGFGLDEATVPVLAAMVGMPGWYHFMSFSGDRPAGVAAMLVDDGVAWFDWAATRPEFRRQGSQSELLNARIRHAIACGCHTLLSETGEAVPGDPQHSFRNLMRAGFEPTHTRENFVPCGSPVEGLAEQSIAI